MVSCPLYSANPFYILLLARLYAPRHALSLLINEANYNHPHLTDPEHVFESAYILCELDLNPCASTTGDIMVLSASGMAFTVFKKTAIEIRQFLQDWLLSLPAFFLFPFIPILGPVHTTITQRKMCFYPNSGGECTTNMLV